MKHLQETVIRDIVDLVTQIKDTDAISGYLNRKNNIKSVAHASAQYTAVFPMLVDNTISIESASVINKAQERQDTSMLQLLFSAGMLSDVESTSAYLKQYHNNLRISNKMSIDELIDIMDKLDESYDIRITEEDKKLLLEDLKNDGYYFEDSINNISISDYVIKESAKGDYVLLRELYDDDKKFIRDEIRADGAKTRSQALDNRDSIRADIKHHAGATVAALSNIGAELSDRIDNLGNNLRSRNTSTGGNKDYADLAKSASDVAKINQTMLVDTDVKKANELVPTMVNVTVMLKKNDEERVPISFLVGVKSKMYPVSSKDIIDRVVKANDDKNVLFKFIKATTKEIGFFRDFMFAIDQAKIDAISQGRKGSTSKLWKVLERRAKVSKFKRGTGIANDAMAITTLAINQTTVDYIKTEYSINLEKESVARNLMDKLNLISIVLVDEVNEISKWIYDTGEDLYQTISFMSLEREASDNSYKKMVNLISRMK